MAVALSGLCLDTPLTMYFLAAANTTPLIDIIQGHLSNCMQVWLLTSKKQHAPHSRLPQQAQRGSFRSVSDVKQLVAQDRLQDLLAEASCCRVMKIAIDWSIPHPHVLPTRHQRHQVCHASPITLGFRQGIASAEPIKRDCIISRSQSHTDQPKYLRIKSTKIPEGLFLVTSTRLPCRLPGLPGCMRW